MHSHSILKDEIVTLEIFCDSGNLIETFHLCRKNAGKHKFETNAGHYPSVKY